MEIVVAEFLEDLQLAQYLPAFQEHGFCDLAALYSITETDFSSMNVKLGHRRKIQRKLFRLVGGSDNDPLPKHSIFKLLPNRLLADQAACPWPVHRRKVQSSSGIGIGTDARQIYQHAIVRLESYFNVTAVKEIERQSLRFGEQRSTTKPQKSVAMSTGWTGADETPVIPSNTYTVVEGSFRSIQLYEEGPESVISTDGITH